MQTNNIGNAMPGDTLARETVEALGLVACRKALLARGLGLAEIDGSFRVNAHASAILARVAMHAAQRSS